MPNYYKSVWNILKYSVRSEYVASQEVNAWLYRQVFKFFLNEVIKSLDHIESVKSCQTLLGATTPKALAPLVAERTALPGI